MKKMCTQRVEYNKRQTKSDQKVKKKHENRKFKIERWKFFFRRVSVMCVSQMKNEGRRSIGKIIQTRLL